MGDIKAEEIVRISGNPKHTFFRMNIQTNLRN